MKNEPFFASTLEHGLFPINFTAIANHYAAANHYLYGNYGYDSWSNNNNQTAQLDTSYSCSSCLTSPTNGNNKG